MPAQRVVDRKLHEEPRPQAVREKVTSSSKGKTTNGRKSLDASVAPQSEKSIETGGSRFANPSGDAEESETVIDEANASISSGIDAEAVVAEQRELHADAAEDESDVRGDVNDRLSDVSERSPSEKKPSKQRESSPANHAKGSKSRKPRPPTAAEAGLRRPPTKRADAASVAAPILQQSFVGMGDVCCFCGMPPPSDQQHAFDCGLCHLVRFCSIEHKKDAWYLHRHTCGRPLPTPESVYNASAEDAIAAFLEYGEAHPALADMALERCIDHVNASTSWHPEDRDRLIGIFASSGGFEGVVRMMLCRPHDASRQSRCAVVLSGYAEGEETNERACEAGVFAALAAALKDHASDSDVLRWAATAVLRLTYDSASRALMAIATGVEEALAETPKKELVRSHPKTW